MLSVSHIASCDVLWTLCLSPSMILIRGREGETQGGMEGGGGESQVCGRSSFTRRFCKHKKRRLLCQLVFFLLLSFVSFRAHRRAHGNSDMTKPIRTLLGMWPNNMKVKGLIRCRLCSFSLLQKVDVWILYWSHVHAVKPLHFDPSSSARHPIQSFISAFGLEH